MGKLYLLPFYFYGEGGKEGREWMGEKGKRRIGEDMKGKGDVEGKAFAGPMSNGFLRA